MRLRAVGGVLVWPVVAEQRPEHVDAAAGQGEDGLGVFFALGSLAVVKAPGFGQQLMLIMAE